MPRRAIPPVRQSRRGVCSALLAGLLAVLVTAACGADSGTTAEVEEDASGALIIDSEEIADGELWAAAQDQGGFTMYTGQSEPQEAALVEAFQDQTGLSVDLTHIPTGRLFERIQSEHAAGVSQADVIRHTDRTLWRSHADEGVLQPYCPLFLDEVVNQELLEENCMFTPTIQSIYAIGYNSALIQPDDAPQSWTDLLDPRWEDSVGLTHIGVGGSAWGRDLFLRDTHGVEYWENLADQSPYIAGSGSVITQELARGEIEVGMVLPGTQALAQEGGAPVATVVPSDGVPSYIEWAGIAAGAENLEAAQVFMNWTMSLAGQTVVTEEIGSYSLRADAPPPTWNGEEQPPIEELDFVFPETTEAYVTDRDAAQAEWFTIFGYQPS
ncbi:ABC transporter substrate-binding protein [Jiangella asiatica]|uniref:Extracellular solute-binding protein n=1 Tax=Jiangella asiatica TaxID=2530372 RepID=A0A4V2Z3P4_9ACTN|nr:extracellular solute-binding protein [Jiangella asiatica]TDE13488.1 extracellular solute-binding protein [Jiangella asiatica]